MRKLRFAVFVLMMGFGLVPRAAADCGEGATNLGRCVNCGGYNWVLIHFYTPQPSSPICWGRVIKTCAEAIPGCSTSDYLYDYQPTGSCNHGQCNSDEPPPDQLVQLKRGANPFRVYVISCKGELVNVAMTNRRFAYAEQPSKDFVAGESRGL